MKRKFPRREVVREQPMPEVVVARLVDLIYRKFYAGHPKAFAQDRARLLAWVVYYPARWLGRRGVSVAPKRYEDILERILMDALANGDFGRIKYLPGYLKEVVERHFEHHGEEYYEEAKRIRNQVEDVLAAVGGRGARERDIVEELVRLDRLTKASKGRKAEGVKGELKGQLTLL